MSWLNNSLDWVECLRCLSVLELSGLDGVLHEECDGHWAYSARNRGDGFTVFEDVLVVDVTCEAVSLFLRWIVYAVDPDVDDVSTALDCVLLDEFWDAYSDEEDVSLTTDRIDVGGARVCDGDGTALVEEERGEGLTDDHTATNDDCALTREFYALALEELDTPCRSTWDESCIITHYELSHIDRVEAVDILSWIDALYDVVLDLAEVTREWRLDEDTANSVVIVEIGDEGAELCFRGLCWECDLARVDS